MREYFFYVLGGVLVVSALGWGLYAIGHAILQVINDWKLSRELDQLEAESASRREKKKQAQIDRLANGCDHDFSGGAIGLKPNTCRKCGLEKEKPSGVCDHIWHVIPGPVPSSKCERCDMEYRPIPRASEGVQQ